MVGETDISKGTSTSIDTDLFLAVDTGGTKTSACLVDLSRPEESRVVGTGRATAAELPSSPAPARSPLAAPPMAAANAAAAGDICWATKAAAIASAEVLSG